MRLSVIIPTKNEVAGIGVLVRYLLTNGGDVEVLVVDHGSIDETLAVARAARARVIESKKAGRAAQMNLGAELATGEALYFLHADTLPPKNFASAIRERLARGCCAGSFCLRFDDPHWSFWWGHFISCLSFTIMRFGDQTLFVERNVFRDIGGFREDMLVFEDQEIWSIGTFRGLFSLL